MKRLILFAGFPGVGKSTIAKHLAQKIGATAVDIDDFKRIEVDSALVKNQIDPPEIRWRYYQKALQHVFGLFDKGAQSVVMDEVFHLKDLRVRLERLCAEQKVNVVWIEVRCSQETVERRLMSGSREGHILSAAEALKMYLLFAEVFEGFSTTKNHIVLNNEGDDVVALVESILPRL